MITISPRDLVGCDRLVEMVLGWYKNNTYLTYLPE